MSAFAGLLERAHAARGRDMALAREIQCEVGGWHRFTPSQLRRRHPGFIAPQDYLGTNRDGSPIFEQMHGTEIWSDPPDVTSSVDAVLALVEREFPDWFWSIGFLDGESRTQDHHLHGALLFPHFHVADPRDGLGHGATPALALVAAVLAAKIAGGAQ